MTHSDRRHWRACTARARLRQGAARSTASTCALRGGELLALLGPNGAGKTTAIGLLLGLMRADAGTVELFGQRSAATSPRAATSA